MQEMFEPRRAFRACMAGGQGARSDPLAGASRRLLDALLRRRWWYWVLRNLRESSGDLGKKPPFPFRSRPPS
jgi:hypothetical protein